MDVGITGKWKKETNDVKSEEKKWYLIGDGRAIVKKYNMIKMSMKAIVINGRYKKGDKGICKKYWEA